MLPEGIQKRKQYNDLIERGVQLLREEEQRKDDFNQLKTEVEEEIGKVFGKDFKKLVKAKFSFGKTQKEAEDKLELLAELEALEKCSRLTNE